LVGFTLLPMSNLGHRQRGKARYLVVVCKFLCFLEGVDGSYNLG